jgi:hypothetical protein
MPLLFVEKLIEEFGPTGTFSELFMVGDAIAVAAQSMELTDEERSAVEAEIAALTFHGGPWIKSCWGTHFRPRSSDEQPDGRILHSPDITHLTADSVRQWKERATHAADPVLKARYADVVWDLEQVIVGSGARSPEFGKMAFDSYLQAVDDRRFGAPILATFPLHRALAIATELNDGDRIKRVSTIILELGDSAPLSSIGIWSMPSSAFLGNRRIPVGFKNRMKAQLEERLASAAQADNEYATYIAGSALLKILRPIEDKSERQRVVKVIGDVHLRAAEQWPSSRAIGVLPGIAILYEQEGLPDEAEAIQLYIEQRGRTLHLEMKTFGYTISLDQDRVAAEIKRIIVGKDAYRALFRLAYACLPDPDKLRKIIEDGGEDLLVSRLIPRSFHGSSGLPMSGVGTTEEDPNGNLVELFGKDLQAKMIYLVLGIRAAREKFKYSPSQLIDEMLVGSPLFREDRREFFEQGLAAYESGDYMKAIHILVPQVENMTRELLGLMGRPKMKRAPKQPKFFEYKNMNDFFREPRIIEALDENLYLFLKTLYIDKRSYNLRNDLVHGLVDAAAFTEQIASLVLQSIILLSMPRPDQVFVPVQENAEDPEPVQSG